MLYAESQFKDHPRVCGEKRKGGGTMTIKEGSPPRVRGKVLPLKVKVHDQGITPACAGKSNS